MKERKSKIQTKSKVQSVAARGGGAKDPRKGKVESEGMIVHRVSRDGKTLKKRNGRKESDEGKEGREKERRIRESGYAPVMLHENSTVVP